MGHLITPSNRRRTFATLAVGTLVLLSACVSVTHVTVDSHVDAGTHPDAEAEIIEYRMEINMSEVVYNSSTAELQDRGYNGEEPLCQALVADLDVNRGQVETVDCSVSSTDSRQILELVLNDFKPVEDGNVSLEEPKPGQLLYQDRMLTRDTLIGRLLIGRALGTVNYTLTMPNDIREANTHRVSSETAHWQLPLNESHPINASSRIFRRPDANFNVDVEAPTAGGEIRFDASHSTDDRELVQYTWTFGDGESGDGEVVYHKYDEPGEYEVVLVVTDDDGLTDRAETTLTVADIRTPTPTVETDDDGPLEIVQDLAPAATIIGTIIAILGYLRRRS